MRIRTPFRACTCIGHLYAIVSLQFAAFLYTNSADGGVDRRESISSNEDVGKCLRVLAEDIFHRDLLLSSRSRWRKSPRATPRISRFSWKISNWIISLQPMTTVPSLSPFLSFSLFAPTCFSLYTAEFLSAPVCRGIPSWGRLPRDLNLPCGNGYPPSTIRSRFRDFVAVDLRHARAFLLSHRHSRKNDDRNHAVYKEILAS